MICRERQRSALDSPLSVCHRWGCLGPERLLALESKQSKPPLIFPSFCHSTSGAPTSGRGQVGSGRREWHLAESPQSCPSVTSTASGRTSPNTDIPLPSKQVLGFQFPVICRPAMLNKVNTDRRAYVIDEAEAPRRALAASEPSQVDARRQFDRLPGHPVASTSSARARK